MSYTALLDWRTTNEQSDLQMDFYIEMTRDRKMSVLKQSEAL